MSENSIAVIITAPIYIHESGLVHISPPQTTPDISQFFLKSPHRRYIAAAKKKSMNAVSMPLMENITAFTSKRYSIATKNNGITVLFLYSRFIVFKIKRPPPTKAGIQKSN